MSDLVDVVGVSERILAEGTRGETSVSNTELRAMARAILDLRTRLGYGARALHYIDRLAEERSPERQRDATEALLTFESVLIEAGCLEAAHAGNAL